MKKQINSMERLVNIVIGLAGLVAICVGVAIKTIGAELQTIMISVGSSMLASAIVAGLSSAYIEKYQLAKEISEEWGILSIQDRRATMNLRIGECEASAKKQIDLIAFGLKSLRDGNTKMIQECLDKGVSVRIITVHPNNESLKEIDRKEGQTDGHTEQSIRQLTEWAKNLKKENRKRKLEIRYSDTIPTEFYNRVDGYIFVGPYQYGRESQQTITQEYKRPGKAFDYYADYFEKLWKDENYCRKCPELY